MQEMTLLKKVCLFVTCFCLLLISTESYSFTTKRSLLPSILYRTSLAAGKPVEITFEPSGKVVMAEQGDVIAEVAAKAGVYIPYKCKQGRCNSCELRLNGRVSGNACKGAQVPGGPTRKLQVVVMNKAPL